jgi:hypothetical protein
VRLEEVSHDITWSRDQLGQTLESAEFEARFSDNSTRKLKIRALPARYFLKGGLYGGLNGWSHGDDKGKFYSEHDVWTLAEPGTRKLVRTLSDHVIEVTDGDEVGYGIVEYGVGKGYARYAEVQDHPPI